VRNPLAGIRGLAEVTRLDMEASSPNRESMDLIVSTVDAFERWLSDLLDATSPAAIQPCQIRVPEWIAGIVEIHRSQATARNVTVHLDAAEAPKAAIFDPKHMDHALSALLSNAIEATPSGGDVWVTARVNDPALAGPSGAGGSGENGTLPTWEMHVIDRGAGIPPQILPQVFQPNFTTKPRGNGLGLAMAQQIVKGHSGRIIVKNGDPAHPERCGASFVIRLPIRPAANDPNSALSKP
jgi:signal transduction histidine kinase